MKTRTITLLATYAAFVFVAMNMETGYARAAGTVSMGINLFGDIKLPAPSLNGQPLSVELLNSLEPFKTAANFNQMVATEILGSNPENSIVATMSETKAPTTIAPIMTSKPLVEIYSAKNQTTSIMVSHISNPETTIPGINISQSNTSFNISFPSDFIKQKWLDYLIKLKKESEGILTYQQSAGAVSARHSLKPAFKQLQGQLSAGKLDAVSGDLAAVGQPAREGSLTLPQASPTGQSAGAILPKDGSFTPISASKPVPQVIPPDKMAGIIKTQLFGNAGEVTVTYEPNNINSLAGSSKNFQVTSSGLELHNFITSPDSVVVFNMETTRCYAGTLPKNDLIWAIQGKTLLSNTGVNLYTYTLRVPNENMTALAGPVSTSLIQPISAGTLAKVPKPTPGSLALNAELPSAPVVKPTTPSPLFTAEQPPPVAVAKPATSSPLFNSEYVNAGNLMLAVAVVATTYEVTRHEKNGEHAKAAGAIAALTAPMAAAPIIAANCAPYSKIAYGGGFAVCALLEGAIVSIGADQLASRTPEMVKTVAKGFAATANFVTNTVPEKFENASRGIVYHLAYW